MNTREIAAEYRLTHWAQIMQERMTSGKSIKEFCKSAGFHENVYYYWQRRLREAAVNQEIMAIPAIEAPKVVSPEGWAELRLTESPTGAATLPIEIGRCRILADMTTDPDLLAKVCKVLLSLC